MLKKVSSYSVFFIKNGDINVPKENIAHFDGL
jgi:hypothetical protein